MEQVDSEQFEKILRYIRSGIESGAKLEAGGEREIWHQGLLHPAHSFLKRYSTLPD